MKKRFCILTVLIGLIAGSLFWMISRGAGPLYHGRSLSYWSTELQLGDQQQQAEAQLALRSMGEKAVPYLIDTLDRPASPLRNTMDKLLSIDRNIERAQAARALGEIGAAASNAIPALVRASHQTKEVFGFPATAALMKIKGESIGPLVVALDDTNAKDWAGNSAILGEFGTNAQAAVPALVRALNSTNSSVRTHAIITLHKIHSNPQMAVPALMNSLDQNQPHNPALNRIQVSLLIGTLGAFEGEAKAAVPVLQQYLGNSNPNIRYPLFASLRRILSTNEMKALLTRNLSNADPNVRSAAESMLKQLDPKAAAQLGAK
ncbi:HEAT repeat domain-containing protein [Pedosphaera parvula]|uniref:PBS lyase HEAT domain protein repeat-containing protein n=1 Tax=Pedosphaera parvula (strain Ellin514) TaxID=320771 RepID=B9XKZ9_PEDPL|nr:HEAT repeat domain-containing protein [Pedosphaera parvula]EEF59493.1 PBS lyase HEAT domain protein repeat-containing protein [Pedosphaera parvula Ellin514]